MDNDDFDEDQPLRMPRKAAPASSRSQMRLPNVTIDLIRVDEFASRPAEVTRKMELWINPKAGFIFLE